MGVINLNGRRFVEHRPVGGYAATPNTIPRTTILVANCLECDRTVELDRDMTVGKMPYCHLFEIEKLLKCACGAKAAKLMAGYYAAEDITE